MTPRWVRWGGTLIAPLLIAGVAVAMARPALNGPATASGQAVRVAASGGAATVYDQGEVDADVVTKSASVAQAVGAPYALGRSASIGMTRVMRGSSVIQVAPSGYRYPMIVTALPSNAASGTMSPQVSALLRADTVVMGERTANLRGAQTGDVVDLVAANGSVLRLTIAMVAPDEVLGGTELAMSLDAANSLGITRDTFVTIWGIGNQNAFEQAVQAQGLYTRNDTRVNQSWDPSSPDNTLGTARTKELLGEFAYLLSSSGSISVESSWVSAKLPAGRELLNSQIPIRARCHNRVAVDLRAALADVAAAGLAGAIEVSNANTYGGCYNPRFTRTGGELGFVSRHTWGQALDTNTVSNCQGCVPKMNCDVVRIFRRHGFAWGGNFRRPDGMHFEWVGERRDQIAYPSKYCPNVGNALAERRAGGSAGGLFVDLPDEIADEHVAAP